MAGCQHQQVAHRVRAGVDETMQHAAWYDDACTTCCLTLLGADAEGELAAQDVPDFIRFVMSMNLCGTGAGWKHGFHDGQPSSRVGGSQREPPALTEEQLALARTHDLATIERRHA